MARKVLNETAKPPKCRTAIRYSVRSLASGSPVWPSAQVRSALEREGPGENVRPNLIPANRCSTRDVHTSIGSCGSTCILRFDGNDRCDELESVAVATTTSPEEAK